jgi:hypothetical protein
VAGLIFAPAYQLAVVAENQIVPLTQDANDLVPIGTITSLERMIYGNAHMVVSENKLYPLVNVYITMENHHTING